MPYHVHHKWVPSSSKGIVTVASSRQSLHTAEASCGCRKVSARPNKQAPQAVHTMPLPREAVSSGSISVSMAVALAGPFVRTRARNPLLYSVTANGPPAVMQTSRFTVLTMLQ